MTGCKLVCLYEKFVFKIDIKTLKCHACFYIYNIDKNDGKKAKTPKRKRKLILTETDINL